MLKMTWCLHYSVEIILCINNPATPFYSFFNILIFFYICIKFYLGRGRDPFCLGSLVSQFLCQQGLLFLTFLWVTIPTSQNMIHQNTGERWTTWQETNTSTHWKRAKKTKHVRLIIDPLLQLCPLTSWRSVSLWCSQGWHGNLRGPPRSSLQYFTTVRSSPFFVLLEQDPISIRNVCLYSAPLLHHTSQ